MNKENIKSNREPKNTHKVPTTHSNRTPKTLFNTPPNQTTSPNFVPSTSLNLQSLRRLNSSKVVTSTPKHSVATSSYTKTGTTTFVPKNGVVRSTLKGGVVRPKSTLGLTNIAYSSYEEINLIEAKDVKAKGNAKERNNNIEEKILDTKINARIAESLNHQIRPKTVEKTIIKPSKNLEKNTISKNLKVVKRPKNENLETNKNRAVPPRNKCFGGLFDVKKRERSGIERRVERIIERDNTKQQSTLSLNLARSRPESDRRVDVKKARPISVPNARSCIRSTNLIRGHAKDSPARDIDNISRTSSVTNLESLETQGRSKPPKKTGSKERVDKDGKKGAPKTNNNQPPHGVAVATPQQPQSFVQLDPKVDPGFHSYSSDSLHDAEIQQLRRQLKEMADEKSTLALQLGEQRGQLNSLQKEIMKLKSFKDESTQEIEKLSEENTTLRNRLRNVAHSPLSDNEKQQLLFENAHLMQSSSAPASIATNILDDTGGDITACTTPDWDKHSSSNVSEVSVACLQDKINQMQETHYSTNEELQATLQELTDLQRQLTDLQQENERLNEEKTLMFDSLCRQTERLNDSRDEVESLKQILYRDRSDETAATQLENVVEREQKLVELLRSAQEERETLLVKLEQIQAELQESRAELIDKDNLISQLSERVKTLECSMDAKHAEHKQMDQELAQAKDQCSSKQIEINRLTDMLENARTKITEIEQDRTLSDKSELDELLDNARKEKDQLESEVAYLKEQLARSKNEIEKLKEQVSVLQEECKVTRNNAKTTQSDLEYKCEKLILEKNNFTEQLQQFQEAVNELQVQTQCHIEDKRQLSAVLSETQRNLSEFERKSLNLETELQELKKLRAEENDEWEKFQNDLLTSVRVANDFKTEAQQELQKIILENKHFREKLRLLEGQLEKIKGTKTTVDTQTEVVLTPQLIYLAKNFEIPPNKPIFRQESKRRYKKVVSLDSANMDALFPILSKERRSKSKESLDDLGKSQESLNKRNKINAGTSAENLNSSRDDLRKGQESVVHKESKKSRFKLFRVKSSENLTNSDKEYDQELENTEKLKKIKFKVGKSHENLTNFEEEIHKDLQKPDPDQNPKKGEKPRKKSKDSVDSISSSEPLDKKPSDFFSRFVKRREKKPQNRNITQHPKFMSVEEELLMKSLDNWYDNIDKTVPEELLSKEDKAIKKLKILYENDHLKEKPVAKKPKAQLAISKPLLTSVVQNPQLKDIVKNNDFTNVEEPIRDSALEYTGNSPIMQPNLDYRRNRIKSDNINRSHDKKWFGFYKSKSLDNLNYFDVDEVTDPYGLKLYRTAETENLNTNDDLVLKSPKFELNRYSSEIQPYDSVSNPRHSDRYPNENVFFSKTLDTKPTVEINLPHTYTNYPEGESRFETNNELHLGQSSPEHPDSIFLETFPHKYEPKIGNDLPKPNIYINYENLDEIIADIPKNLPESSLSEEQKFALKLKLAFDWAEKKTAIKKRRKKSLKKLQISPPTRESVEKNWKLKEILLNPHINSIQDENKRFSDLYVDSNIVNVETRRHSADIDETDDFSARKSVYRSSSKSYQDIQFSFAPDNHSLDMVYLKQNMESTETDTDKKKSFIESDSSNSSYSYTSGEFNLDTGNVSTILDENLFLKDANNHVQKITSHKTDGNDEVKNNPFIHDDLNLPLKITKTQSLVAEDLLYNETISKKEKRKSIETSADDLGYNETLVKKVGLKATKIVSIGQDPRIEEAEKQYKKDLQEIIHRMKVEEKIKPFLHPRISKYKVQVSHVHYQEPESVVNIYDKEEAIISNDRVEAGQNYDKDAEDLDNTSNVSKIDNDDSFVSYRSSDISKLLDSSTDSLVLPDSSRDFIHSSGFADQEYKNNFVDLSNHLSLSLDIFLEEERKATDSNISNTKNKLVDKIRTPSENLGVPVYCAFEQNTKEFDVAEQDSNRYTYQEMERENKYGVVSPYEVRYSYKNVVTEIKRKFSMDDIIVPNYLKDGREYASQGTRNSDTFMDKCYSMHTQSDDQTFNLAGIGNIVNKVVAEEDKKISNEDVVNMRKEELLGIDKEMHEIMEKYLFTRASLIVKKNFNKEHHKIDELLSNLIEKSNLKKYENVENLHELKIFERENSEANVNEKNNETSLIDDYLNLNGDMKQKYIAKNVKNDLPKEQFVFTEQEIEDKYQNLTQEELNLINSVKKERFSRPLSEINERDIFLVEEITKRYFDEDSRSDSPRSSVLENKEKPSNVEIKSSEIVCLENPKVSKSSEDLLPVENLSAKVMQEVQIPVMEPIRIETKEILQETKSLAFHENSNIVSHKNQMKPTTLPLNSNFDNFKSFLPNLTPLSPLSDQESNFTRVKSNQEFRTSSLKQSLIPLRIRDTQFGSLPPDVRKNKINKSIGSHFQRRSLDVGLSYQPVYMSKSKSFEVVDKKTDTTKIEKEINKEIQVKSNSDNFKNEPLCKKKLFKEIQATNANKSESFYTNTCAVNINISQKTNLNRIESTKNENKPIPKPRIKSQPSFLGSNDLLLETDNTSTLPEGETDKKLDTDIDNNQNVINMIDNNQNSSKEIKKSLEIEDASSSKENIDILQEVKETLDAKSTNIVEELQGIPKEFQKSEIVQAKVVYLDDTESEIDFVPEQVIQKIVPSEEIKKPESVIKRNKNPIKTLTPETFFGRKNEIVPKMSEESNASSSKGSLPSKSSIRILGKREELDITQTRSNAEEVEEVPRSNSSVEPSHVNLFKLESDQSYDSYLELFKSEADQKFDNITGKQQPTKGVIQYAIIGEEISDDSYSATDSISVTEGTPKIVDFVPLDDKTEPYFTKEGVASVSSTLERENTFQILNQAKSMADTSSKRESEKRPSVEKTPSNIDKHDFNCSLKVLARTPSNFSKGSSKSQTDASRTSFSNAKKLFEALVEAHKTEENPKPKTPPKYQVRNEKSGERNFVNKESGGGSKNIVRETVLLIKDGKHVPVESKSSKNMVRETVLLPKDENNISVNSENQK